MTESQALTAIGLAILGDDGAGKTKKAQSFLKMAILKVGRLPNVRMNKTDVTFDLTAGKSEYVIGVDILSAIKDVRNVEELWRNDTTGEPITVIPLSQFNKYARGSDASGSPCFATVHSDEKKLEIYPSPSSAYEVWGYVTKKVENFSQVPSDFHDVLVSVAIQAVHATTNPILAGKLAEQGMNDIQSDSMTKWTGTHIEVDRPLARDNTGIRADSKNLRGD